MTSTLGGRAWADVDEEDEEAENVSPTAQSGNRFETAPDANGIKTVMEYKERDGKTYKVTKRVRVNKVTKWTNSEMIERKSMEKFGKAKVTSEGIGAQKLSQSEDVPIELCKKTVVLTQADNAEDKFLEEALKGCESLFKEKKVWATSNRDKQIDRETTDTTAPAPTPTPATETADAKAPAAGKYEPPSVRAAREGGKGAGKNDPGQEASLRITNLSELCEEDTLRALFQTCGALQRVYLAKDENYFCKGFAFVTYWDKKHAEKAITKLNGHGLDNLIMQVQWAKPRT